MAGGRYAVERYFGRLPPEIAPARVSMVAVDSRGFVHVLRRGPVPVVVFDADGAFQRSYGGGQIFDPHGITVDHQDRVLIVDRDAHQVLAFDTAGALLFTLCERHSPSWEQPFNHPTKVAVAADGEIYVADGYANARVHRFDPHGRLLASFGAVGHGPGAFLCPHSVIVDQQNRVVVVDRENDRVQLFDRRGRWLETWDGLSRPMDLCQMGDGTILVTDHVPSLTAFSATGQRLGRARPSLNGSHGIALAPDGTIYLAETEPSAITKLAPLDHTGDDGNVDRAAVGSGSDRT